MINYLEESFVSIRVNEVNENTNQSVITLSDEGIENEGGGRADHLWVQYDRLPVYIIDNFLEKTVYFNVHWIYCWLQ